MSESDFHLKNKALRLLRAELEEFRPPDSVSICFVLSYPRSDMGKGTIVAQAMAALPNADVIKFDGLLNTNKSGRHTAPGHDDFGTYELFNPGRTWGRDNYILGGELYRDFIDRYGELENLRLRQHLSLFLELTLYRMWDQIKADTLFVEVGGVLTDAEAEPLFVPLIQRLQQQRKNTNILLLTESGHNGEYIKTKTVQDAIKLLLDSHIVPTIIAVREPEVLKTVSPLERVELERDIISRIDDNLGRQFYKVISIPYFDDSQRVQYTTYVRQRLVPMLMQSQNTITELVVGTSNDAKFQDFKVFLGDAYHLVKGSDLRQGVDIAEGMHSIEENAIAKARAWAMLTGKPAIGDDTGFFIPALKGEPGVATRRWGGELGEKATNADFWAHLQAKVMPLEDASAYVEQCVAIALPDGRVKTVFNRTEGYVDKEKLQQPYNNTGYPLAAAFVATKRTKAWDEMSADEKRAFDAQYVQDLQTALSQLSQAD